MNSSIEGNGNRTSVHHTQLATGGRRRSWSASVACCFLAGAATEAFAVDDAVPSVALTCETCSTRAQLEAVAHSYFVQWKMSTPTGFPSGKYVRPCYYSRWLPNGELQEAWFDNCTVAVVASKQYPFTGIFEFSALSDGAVYTNALTPSDVAAKELDAEITARATAMPPVELPPGYSPADEPEVIFSELYKKLQVDGGPETDYWHGLTHMGQFVRWRFFNVQQGKHFWIYQGDTITIKYSNGHTEKLRLINPTSTIKWERVEGTLRDAEGRDPNSPNSTTSAAPYGNQTFTYTYGGNTLTVSYVPVVYNVPGSRINRQGVVITITQQQLDNETEYME